MSTHIGCRSPGWDIRIANGTVPDVVAAVLFAANSAEAGCMNTSPAPNNAYLFGRRDGSTLYFDCQSISNCGGSLLDNFNLVMTRAQAPVEQVPGAVYYLKVHLGCRSPGRDVIVIDNTISNIVAAVLSAVNSSDAGCTNTPPAPNNVYSFGRQDGLTLFFNCQSVNNCGGKSIDSFFLTLARLDVPSASAVEAACVPPASGQPPGPMAWEYSYDSEGNLKSATDPNGQLTAYCYDGLQQRRSIVQPAPGAGQARPVIRLDHDAGGRIGRVKDPRGLDTVYDTDGLGRVLSIRSPDSGLTTFTHDEAGNPITRTDARGITHLMTYGPGNRLERIDYPSGTPTVYEFGDINGPLNARARLARITDESGSTSYRYDAKGRILQKTQVVNSAAGSRTFTVATDWGKTGIVTGEPVRIVYPSGASVEIGYEYAGRPGSITVTRNGQASILLSGVTYNALHALKGWTWGDGSTYQRSFDSFLRLSSYPLGNPAGTGAAMGLTRTLSYDNAGNITGYLHTGQPGFDQTHRYDGLDRLVETLKTSTRYGYQYDATGNRRVREIGGDSYLHTVEDGSNRLASVQEPGNTGTVTRTYQYGPIGNLTGDGVNTFVYSDRGRMSRADTPNGSVSYLVNGLEQRVSKTGLTVPGGAAYYVYTEEGGLLGEYDTNGTPLYEVIYLRGTPVGVMTPTGLYYVYADHIDTPRVIARNTDHAIVWRWDEAEAFGATPPNEDPNGLGGFTLNMRFPGQVYDRETGLFYNVNRDYSPSEGRYRQFDPIGLAGGPNGYQYVMGNPVSYTDSSGLLVDTAGLYTGASVAAGSLTGTSAIVAGTGVGLAAVGSVGAGLLINYGVERLTGDSIGGHLYDLLNPSPATAPPVTPAATPPAGVPALTPKDQEYAAYKRICDSPPPPNLDKCEFMRWKIMQLRACVTARKMWDVRWGSIHEHQIRQKVKELKIWERRLENAWDCKKDCP